MARRRRVTYRTRNGQATFMKEKEMDTMKLYDMTDHKEVMRWFREMEGYLQVDDFLNQGTDRPGRRFALEGFYQLKEWFIRQEEMK